MLLKESASMLFPEYFAFLLHHKEQVPPILMNNDKKVVFILTRILSSKMNSENDTHVTTRSHESQNMLYIANLTQ